MKCKQAQQLLSRFQDRELPAASMAAVEAHLSQCAGCRGDLEAQQRAWEVLGHLVPVAAPDLVGAVERRLASSLPRVCLESLRPRGVGFALAAAGLVGLFVWTGLWAGRVAPMAAAADSTAHAGDLDRPFAELTADAPPGLEVVALLDQIGGGP